MRWRSGRLLAAILLLVGIGELPMLAQTEREDKDAAGAAKRLVQALDDPALQAVLEEILDRNPELAGAAARARAAALRAPQRRALPDPMVGLTAFVAPPETRVGPQRMMVAFSQRLPWLGKLALGEQAALLESTALSFEVEGRRVQMVTEARRLWYELAFLELQRKISEGFRGHLAQHEEVARTRYATGVGSGQGVIKLHAELTRVDSQLLDIRERQAGLAARLGRLRDRPSLDLPGTPVLPQLDSHGFDRPSLERRALGLRPEVAAAGVRIARAEVLEKLAGKRSKPDFTLGLTYTLVDSRRDEPGRLQPPSGNGDDIFGIQGGLNLPVRRGKLRAGLDEARELRFAADEMRRAVQSRIVADLDELTDRIPLGWRQLRLLDDVLIVQAEEALDSARAGYVVGTLNALDLLDAEHVLFGARTAVARAAADYAIYLARLEGVVAGPLEDPTS